jgi:lysozyme
MKKITRVSKDCLHLIEEFECGGDFRKHLTAYKCPAGVWTIGMGTTRYPDHRPVMPGDRITEMQAYEYLTYDLAAAESTVSGSVIPVINQHQFDALVSFTYNLGSLAFSHSALLKMVNANLADPGIHGQFMRWVNARGKPLQGLIRRRQAESWLYLHGELKYHF